MNNHKRVNHLKSICEILQDRAVEVVDMSQRAQDLWSKEADLTDRIAASRVDDVEELLRSLALRCVRLADEVATLKG